MATEGSWTGRQDRCPRLLPAHPVRSTRAMQVSWLAGPCAILPSQPWPVAFRILLAAYSCGGSHGLDPKISPCSLFTPRLSAWGPSVSHPNFPPIPGSGVPREQWSCQNEHTESRNVITLLLKRQRLLPSSPSPNAFDLPTTVALRGAQFRSNCLHQEAIP